jgi:hypothetical protein
MIRPDVKALEITTQIVEAKISNSSLTISKANGTAVADFFEEIYRGVLKITTEIESNDD